MFGNQFRASFEDDAYDYFDEKMTSEIANRNLANAEKIMRESRNAFANHEDLSLYENNTVYKTTVE